MTDQEFDNILASCNAKIDPNNTEKLRELISSKSIEEKLDILVSAYANRLEASGIKHEYEIEGEMLKDFSQSNCANDQVYEKIKAVILGILGGTVDEF